MSKNRSAAGPTLTRKQLSHAERDRLMRRSIIIGTIVVGALLALLLGYAALDLLVLQPGQPVARVNGTTITLDEFEKAVRFRRYEYVNQYLQLSSNMQVFAGNAQFTQYFQQQLQQISQQLSDTNGLGRNVLQDLVDDQLIRKEAARRGITVSPAELDARVREFFGYYPQGTPTPTVTPTEPPTYAAPTVNPTVVAAWTPTPTLTPTATLTMTETPTPTNTPGPTPTATATDTPEPTSTPVTTQAYATRVASFNADVRTQANLSDSDIRHFIESQAYRDKLSALIEADVPNTEEQVHARHILVKDEATAKIVQDKLRAGENWDALAAQYSIDTSNASNGGDLGWFGKGRMVAEFETAAYSTTVGTISGPIKSQFGYHLIQVLGKEQRPLTSSDLTTKRQQAFTDWLTKQRAATGPDGKALVEQLDVWVTHVPTTPALPAGSQ